MRKPIHLLNLLVVATILMMTSCAKEELATSAPIDIRVDNGNNLDELISALEADAAAFAEENPRAVYGDQTKRPDFLRFDVLREALRSTGLAPVVAGGGLTVFCPSDAAFAEIGITLDNVAEVDGLADILLYHVVGGTVFSTDLSNGFVPTVNGASVQIQLTDAAHIFEFPLVNESVIYLFDETRFGSVFHGISSVLLPPTSSIADLAIATPQFSVLVDALVRTGLDGVVAGEGNFTVFAPTNQAFIDLGINLDDLSDEDLTNILLYHVVSDARVFSSDLTTGPVSMTNGGTINIDADALTISDTGSDSDAGIILQGVDIQATNGVIHAIDKVLLP